MRPALTFCIETVKLFRMKRYRLGSPVLFCVKYVALCLYGHLYENFDTHIFRESYIPRDIYETVQHNNSPKYHIIWKGIEPPTELLP